MVIRADILRLRQKLKMTQTELADNLGVTLNTVQNWEAGICKPSRLAVRQINHLARKAGFGAASESSWIHL